MVLVTGGCGYIGSHTLVDLIEHKFDVVSIDNLSNSNGLALDGIKSITSTSVTNYQIDLCDYASVEKFFSTHTITAVIHFAALKLVADSVANPIHYYKNNIDSLLTVLSLCAKYKVKDFIFSSSCSVYGNAQHLPVDENTPFGKPQSPYAATKQMGEQIVRDFCKAYPINAVLLRYFNPVGAHTSAAIGEQPLGIPQNLVPAITKFASGKLTELKIWGTDYSTRDGSCVRDYIHVTDIAHAHTLALQYLQRIASNNFCDIFNLGSGNGITVLEVIQAFEKVTGIALAVTLAGRREGDVVEVYADNKKAKELLGWQCIYSLDDMMLTAWNWENKIKHL